LEGNGGATGIGPATQRCGRSTLALGRVDQPVRRWDPYS
jgi:hypothetical protein